MLSRIGFSTSFVNEPVLKGSSSCFKLEKTVLVSLEKYFSMPTFSAVGMSFASSLKIEREVAKK